MSGRRSGRRGKVGLIEFGGEVGGRCGGRGVNGLGRDAHLDLAVDGRSEFGDRVDDRLDVDYGVFVQLQLGDGSQNHGSIKARHFLHERNKGFDVVRSGS